MKPVNSTDTTFDKTKAQLIDLLPCQALTNNIADNPNPDLIDYFLVHGDYLILNGEGAQVALQAIIQAGEEL